ncbi:MAG: histidine phosphatase family protein [Ruminococcus sp.]|nr:histidine phosphatase family protein [Ruminococcus sp.]
MKIYSARHGETVWNKEDRICGITDVELTEKGIEQAKALADKVEKLNNIDIIICSPISRAIKTAKFSAERIGKDIIIDNRLTEWDYGSYEGKHRSAEGFAQAKTEFGCKMPDGGESLLQLAHRVYSLLDEIKETYKDKNILLVCHGGVCRVIETYFKDMTTERFSHFFMGNCELREYEVLT